MMEYLSILGLEQLCISTIAAHSPLAGQLAPLRSIHTASQAPDLSSTQALKLGIQAENPYRANMWGLGTGL